MKKREYEKEIRELNDLVREQTKIIEAYKIKEDMYYIMLGQNSKLKKAYSELLDKYTQQTATLRVLLGITEKNKE